MLDEDIDLNTQGLEVWLDRAVSRTPIRIHHARHPMQPSAPSASTAPTAASRRASRQLTLDDLAAGDVVVRVAWSDINYKDALAATGAAPILRRYPLVGGIDLSGVVVSSADPRYTPGSACSSPAAACPRTHDGGYAEIRARRRATG